ncbi:MAG: ABC transporter permease [ANME-2 cluster archaeon]|nr:ABC transporter permease [ANME-2 cluster archaeon]MBC2700096.1 ABC transporter permease [ANME-2 cluster archaeon]MBC2707387.1 ABC transporter permease [ANME-2 cluster archaeon]MBC2762627.1 ABC transporter permease [ANME-2 cluster archaeon]
MKDFLYLAWKDLLMEFRTKQMLNSMVIFSLLVIVIFNYSFSNILFNVEVADIAPGILWIAFTFAGMLGLSRSFASEMEEGCLDGLKLCPVDPSTIYLGKVVSNLVIMFMIEAIIVPLFIVLFNFSDVKGLAGLIVIILLGTIGFILVGTLFSALTVNMRTREILLPVILFPIIIPLIMSSVMATQKVLSTGDLFSAIDEIKLLVVYDLVFFIAAQLVFEYVIED